MQQDKEWQAVSESPGKQMLRYTQQLDGKCPGLVNVLLFLLRLFTHECIAHRGCLKARDVQPISSLSQRARLA